MFKDKRSAKIALVAHCILNQNSRAIGLAEKQSAIAEIVNLLIKNEIGILQMPCPELTYAGASRPPQTRDQYNHTEFRRHCKKIAEETAKQVQEYAKCNIKLKIIIGIKDSPSCNIDNVPGIFIEQLQTALERKAIKAPFYGLNLKNVKEDLVALEKLINE